MIKFDKNDMVDIASLNEEEARIFILFLLYERRRHRNDIEFIDGGIREACKRFGWEYAGGE